MPIFGDLGRRRKFTKRLPTAQSQSHWRTIANDEKLLAPLAPMLLKALPASEPNSKNHAARLSAR
jgi:hypothetical protein